MSFESKPSKPALVRHKIGAQSSPPAIVLIYSRSDKPEKMRKRVMPLRGLKAFADGEAIAKLMQEAHKEFLDPAHVSVEQLAGLCEKLRCGQAGGAKSAAAPPPPVAPLSRELLREVECDLPSPSSASDPSLASIASAGAPQQSPNTALAAFASGAATATETAVATFGAASSSDDGSPPGRVPSILAPLPAQPSATKKGAKGKAAKKGGGPTPKGKLAPLAAQRQPTLESLLGMSESDDDDDGAARLDAELAASAKVTRPAALPGLAGMPPLRAL